LGSDSYYLPLFIAEFILKKEHNILVRAFRAVDDPAACLQFLKGHASVLERFKIAHITSNNIAWTENECTIVFTMESLDTGELLGGGRLQVYDYKLPLPIETAIGYLDDKVYELVSEWAQEGVAEFSGLWNTREAVKMGLSSIFISRIGNALAYQLKLGHVIALVAPAIVKTSYRSGFLLETNLGNDGVFYYPKVDLIATVFRLSDVVNLLHADEEERQHASELRGTMNLVRMELLRENVCNIHYELEIENLFKSNFYHLSSSKEKCLKVSC